MERPTIQENPEGLGGLTSNSLLCWHQAEKHAGLTMVHHPTPAASSPDSGVQRHPTLAPAHGVKAHKAHALPIRKTLPSDEVSGRESPVVCALSGSLFSQEPTSFRCAMSNCQSTQLPLANYSAGVSSSIRSWAAVNARNHVH